jgi:hypothetical protein
MSQSDSPNTEAGRAHVNEFVTRDPGRYRDRFVESVIAIEQEAGLLDAAELARVHCDALHSATHTPKLPRPCISSQDQMKIVAAAHNATR